MMLFTTFLLLCITLSHQYYVAPNTTIEAKKSDHKIRMGFGSCYDGLQESAKGEGNIMHTISRDDKLDLWVWLGDMAYVDKKVLKRKATIWEYALHFSMIQRIPFAMAIFRYLGGHVYIHEEDRRYLFNLTYSHPPYTQMRMTTPTIGIWDDHDYGVNDGDAKNPIKVQQKQVFLDYLEVPQEGDERRSRGDQNGIYFHQIIRKGGYKVLLIVFDVRYERNTYEDILSETQWAWFEKVLNENTDASLLLISSGIQFLLNNRLFNAEHWPQSALHRIMNMTSKYFHPRVPLLFLSGDVHHAQFMQTPCSLKNFHNRKIYELSTSGLTHTCDRNLFGLCEYALQGNTPIKYQGSEIIAQFNFGVIEIDLKDQIIKIQVKNRENQILIERKMRLELSGEKKSYAYCENYVFQSSVWFEKIVHFCETMIQTRNKFLIFGVLGAIFGFGIVFEGIKTLIKIIKWARQRRLIKKSDKKL